MSRSKSVGLEAWAVPSLLAATLIASPVWAQEPRQAFNIPSRDLPTALEAFGRQSGKEILFDRRASGGRTSVAVVGDYPAEEALRRLLGDSGLILRRVNADTFLVEPAPTQGRTALVGGEPANLDDIIVTARRREEKADDIPLAITALSGDALERQGEVNLQRVAAEASSVTSFMSNPRNVAVNIRGLGAGISTNNVGIDLGVGFYVDEVYYPRVNAAVFNYLDIDRVEVLRGPQGTLFGRNTTAGAISVVSRKPDFSTGGTIYASAGNYNYFSSRGFFNAPLIDDVLAARISYEVSTRGGFVKNEAQANRIHDLDSQAIRGQILYKPLDTLELRLIADYSRQTQTCCVAVTSQYITASDNGVAIAFPFLNRVGELGYDPGEPDDKSRTVSADRIREFSSTEGGVSANAVWDLGSHTLTSISAYRFWDTVPRNDGDATPLDVYVELSSNDRQRQFSQELRLASHTSGPLEYILGLYYFHQTHSANGRTETGGDAGQYFITPGTSGLTADQLAATLDGAYTLRFSYAKMNSYAGFGQATWHINPSLSLTGGLRYTYEEKSGHFEQTRGSVVDTAGLNAAQIALRNAYNGIVPFYALDKSWGGVSGLLTLSQEISQHGLIYATYSRGSKSGGLNIANLPKDSEGNLRTDLAIVSPEKVNHYEIGAKSNWFDRRLFVNLSAFNTQILDFQSTSTLTLGTSTTPISYLSNAGTVRSRGVEAEIRARPIDGLALNAAYTYADATYRDYKDVPCPFERYAAGQSKLCDLSGNQLPAAPRHSLALSGEYSTQLNNTWSGHIGADYTYRSAYDTTYNNSRYSRVSGYGIANLQVGVTNAAGWDLSAWVRNVFDVTTFTSVSLDETTGRVSGFLTDPRTVGATLRRSF